MKPRGLPSLIALTVFALGAAVVACANAHQRPDITRLPAHTDQAVLQMLDRIPVVPDRPNPPGYDRDCGPGSGCVFGTPWTDDHRGTDGHNGCDTRNDVLRRQLTDVVLRPGSNRCAVSSGTLRDPYTGALVAYGKGTIEIDHVLPLALAWDLGADEWTPDRRIDFANDQANLLAATRAVNRSKSDKGPAEWLPHVEATRQCDYAKRFLTVALGYKLPITRADADAIRSTATNCT